MFTFHKYSIYLSCPLVLFIITVLRHLKILATYVLHCLNLFLCSKKMSDSNLGIKETLGYDESSDDLEKTLVLIAANADARANEVHCENPIEETEQHKTAALQSESRGIKLGNEEKIESYKRFKTSDGQAIVQANDGYANVVASHYNKLEEKGLFERSKSRIFYMRNFHNWIKSMLINEYLTKVKQGKKHNSAIKVLDMCCGKGGDLLKWRKGGITHLICSDIASVSLEQCKSRYFDMKNRINRERYPSNIYTIEYVAADCSKIRLREKYKDPSVKLDLVSCQFAFHYSFESLSQAECMIRNAGECLHPGGFFIGTIPDANELITRLRKSHSKKIGNDVYQVTFNSDITKPDLFGVGYNFHLDGVVDCPEFLVYFPVFVKLARKYGLKLVQKEKFCRYYERMKMEGRNLLSTMQSLETYPPYSDTVLVGTADDDYDHAKENLKRVSNEQNVRIGTLSKSEWEASSLYITFAFEKVKHTWNTDGTPLYDI